MRRWLVRRALAVSFPRGQLLLPQLLASTFILLPLFSLSSSFTVYGILVPPAGNAMKNKIGVSGDTGLNRCALKDRTGSDETSNNDHILILKVHSIAL